MISNDDFSISDYDDESSDDESVEWEPLTSTNSKDEWIERLIELAVNAHEKHYSSILYSNAQREGVKVDPDAKNNAFDLALWQFIACYIEIDERFIDTYSLESDVIKTAKLIFNNHTAIDDVVSFERYITAYCTTTFGYESDNNEQSSIESANNSSHFFSNTGVNGTSSALPEQESQDLTPSPR